MRNCLYLFAVIGLIGCKTDADSDLLEERFILAEGQLLTPSMSSISEALSAVEKSASGAKNLKSLSESLTNLIWHLNSLQALNDWEITPLVQSVAGTASAVQMLYERQLIAEFFAEDELQLPAWRLTVAPEEVELGDEITAGLIALAADGASGSRILQLTELPSNDRAREFRDELPQKLRQLSSIDTITKNLAVSHAMLVALTAPVTLSQRGNAGKGNRLWNEVFLLRERVHLLLSLQVLKATVAGLEMRRPIRMPKMPESLSIPGIDQAILHEQSSISSLWLSLKAELVSSLGDNG